MKLSGLPILSSLQRNKGSINWYDSPHGVTARKRPWGRKTAISEAEQIARNTFAAATYMMKYVDPLSLIEAQKLAHGRALYPRDVLMSAMYGKLYPFYVGTPTPPSGEDMYQLLYQVTVPSDGETITFPFIDQTYEDLIVTFQGQSTYAGAIDKLDIFFNSDTGTNYGWQIAGAHQASTLFQGIASVAYQSVAWLSTHGMGNQAASFAEIKIPNYTGGSWWKTSTAISSGTYDSSNNGFAMTGGGIWRSTAAITQIDLTPHLVTGFKQNSRGTLWGRKVST